MLTSEVNESKLKIAKAKHFNCTTGREKSLLTLFLAASDNNPFYNLKEVLRTGGIPTMTGMI